MIVIKNLSKSYGNDLVLNSVSCHIERNTPTALLGPSGAGKSTLLRCINGLVFAEQGQVFVDGKELQSTPKELREFRKGIGIIFQQFNLVKRLTVLENVLCGRLAYTPVFKSLLKKFSGSDYEIAGHYLEKVGLYEKRFQKVSELSGGQQQRVGIARALVQQPKVLLADEPVASLDPKTSESIMELLINISEEENITPVITLHSVDLALKYSRKIIGLNQGHVVQQYDTEKTSSQELYSLYDDKNQEAGA